MARVGAVVLVPLDHRAVFHPRPLGGYDFCDGPIAQHHAAGMDAQVPGQAVQPVREVEYVFGGYRPIGDRLRRCTGRVVWPNASWLPCA